MKKFIFSLITFILLGTTLCGGIFLLAGCDYSQSQEENKQENGNNSDSENGSSVSDGENDINDGDNSEDQAINSDHDVHVVSFFRTSDSAVYQSSENMDNNTYPRDIFHIS